jgi:hypothetical protein
MSVPQRVRRVASAGRAILFATCIAGSPGAQAAPPDENGADEVVVNGARGSVVADIQPVATFDSKFVESLGAPSMGDLLRILEPMTRSADGKPPIFLLNGQRTSGYEEIGSLPPEAIEKFELLPEQAALRFGYPPTQRVLNVITKARFRTVEVKANGGTSTEGGGGSRGTNLALTRIARPRRLTLTGEYRHSDPLRQSRRHVLPDPANLYDPIGNVAGAAGGEIDPALSAAAGHPVAIAAVPADPTSRDQLSAYLAGADHPRVFDLGRYRTLVSRTDAFKGSAVLATPIGKTVSGSFSLSGERSTDHSLQGLPAVPILVPASNPHSPFSRDVLLYRYIGDDPKHARSVTTTINAGGALRGNLGGWYWDLTATLFSKDVSAHDEVGLDVAAIGRAVADGADPFGPLTAGRLTQQSHSISRKGEVKAVATGVVVELPAGEVRATATAMANRATSHTIARSYVDTDIAIASTLAEGGASIDVPLASREHHSLPFMGEISANLSGTVRHVEGFGTLTDTNYGLTWAPLKGLQWIASVKRTQTAPDMEKRSLPRTQSFNTPYFDFLTGQSVFVTLISGGNPDLLAEHKIVRSLAMNLQPWAKRQLTLSVDYHDTITRNVTGQLNIATAAGEAAFPDQFVRDANGHLTTVFIQPVNFYRQHQRAFDFQLMEQGQLGKASPPKPGVPPRQRPYAYVGVGAWHVLSDELQLRAGQPRLDLLGGQTINGVGETPTVLYGWGGLNYMGIGGNLNAQWFSPMHVRQGTPQTDLDFASRFTLAVSLFTTVHHWTPEVKWTKGMQVTFDVTNLLNAKWRVRDATGATPYAFQPANFDALGRTVKLTLRKLF